MAIIQLKSVNCVSNISNNWQQQIYGGLDNGGNYNYYRGLISTSPERIESLWSGYVSGDYNIRISSIPGLHLHRRQASRYASGTYIIFTAARDSKDSLDRGDYIGTIQI